MPSATSEQGGHGSPERLKRDAALAVATGFAIQSALVVTGPLLARMLGPSGRGYLAALILWPLVLLYGGALIPAPAGGGAMEFGFSAIMRDILPPDVLAAALIWWRLYSYYIYVALGALAAGRTVMRALNAEKRPRAAA